MKNKDFTLRIKPNGEDITVILTCYRRPHLLTQQIEAINQQTCPPKEIWIWKNYHEDNATIDWNSFNVDAIFNNNVNWKYCGRFACALLARTKFIAIFDDDTIPGIKWLENCLGHIKYNEPKILGGAGVILQNNQYFGHHRVGWPSANRELQEVDLVGHAWFFPRYLLTYFWIEDTVSIDTGEDIHFSYTCQKYGGIQTYCPPHPIENKDLWSSLYPKLGEDNKTISVTNHTEFFGLRNACVQYYINAGWKPLFIRT